MITNMIRADVPNLGGQVARLQVFIDSVKSQISNARSARDLNKVTLLIENVQMPGGAYGELSGLVRMRRHQLEDAK